MSQRSSQAQAPTIWIAVHDLSRTGVPVLLVTLLQAISPQQRACVHVIAISGGPLLSELRSLCATVTVVEPNEHRSVSEVASLGLRTLGMASAGDLVRHTVWRAKLARRPKPDVLVVHGAGAWPVAEVVGSAVPVVLHLQELDTALDRSIPRNTQAAAFQRARAVIAVSGPVAALAQRRGAQGNKILTIPGCVQLLPQRATGDSTGLLNGSERWVLGAGTPGWRKGTDRLAAVAHELVRAKSSVQVGWLGGQPNGPDAAAVGRADPVTWIPEQADPWPLLSRADVFVLPSREDPLPLVALEAGVHRRAVVAMPTGGLPELFADGRGMVGSSQDLRWFVGAVQQILNSPALAGEMGERLHDYVRTHHDADVIAPAWFDVLGEHAQG